MTDPVFYPSQYDDRKGNSGCRHPILVWKKAIDDIGGTMPEELAPEPSIKPLLDAKNRKRKNLPSKSIQDDTITDTSPQDTLWE